MLRVLLVLLTIVSFAACGGKNETETTQTQSQASQGRSIIPDKVDTPVTATNVFLRPYFDENGTVSELAVAPGETFTVFVVAEYEKPYSMSAAEFSLAVPAGVSVKEIANFMEKALTMGEYKTDYVMAFGCQPPRKFYLVKFVCSAEAEFAGGSIKTAPGINVRDESYLGFVSCEPQIEKVPATGGTATLTRK